MAKQKLGERKLKRCREIGNRPYESAWVRGGWPHYNALCYWTDQEDQSTNADWINYQTGEFIEPHIRKGEFVEKEEKGEVTWWTVEVLNNMVRELHDLPPKPLTPSGPV